MQSLADNWSNLASRLGLANDAERLWTMINVAYSEPHRHYHALSHIADIVSKFEPLRELFSRPEPVELALFFHDIVYDPARHDNEEKSADLLRNQLARLDAATIDKACACIAASARHKATGDAETDLFLDLDMSILGAPWETYLVYAQGVAREYLPVYGPEAYRSGRTALFLEPTLAHDRIFLTPSFQPLEAQARMNLATERDLWRTGSLF